MGCFFWLGETKRELVSLITHSIRKMRAQSGLPFKSACVTFSVVLLALSAGSWPLKQQQAFLCCMASHLHTILSSFCYSCTFSTGIPSTGRLLARLEVYSWLHINHTSVPVLTHSCTGSITLLHPPFAAVICYFYQHLLINQRYAIPRD